MIALPAPNTMTRPYRGLSVQDVDWDLRDESGLLTRIASLEVYRRTVWLLLRNGTDLALMEVTRTTDEPLFAPVAEARVLASPDRIRWIEDPRCDVGNATALAAATLANQDEGIDAFAVLGRFEHVNVIWRPSPVSVRVTEVVPPEPAKLVEMAQQAVAFDEDLPPVQLVVDAVDIRRLSRDHPAERYLLPCRGAGVDVPGDVTFLDTRPAARADWLLIGCERSAQFHRHFYGDEPPRVDLCPRRRAATTAPGELVLTKCCLLERGVEHHPVAAGGAVAVVPWGATLDEVRAALRLLTGAGPLVERERIGASLTP